MLHFKVLDTYSHYKQACMYAILCDYERFIEHYAEISDDDSFYMVNRCICRGCRFSLEFAKKVLECPDIEFNVYISRSISARFIMSNDLSHEIIKKEIPLCIWYPQCPKKKTCIELLKIHEDYHYVVGAMSIIKNWMDVYERCEFEGCDVFIHCVARMQTKGNYLEKLSHYDNFISVFNQDKYLLKEKGDRFRYWYKDDITYDPFWYRFEPLVALSGYYGSHDCYCKIFELPEVEFQNFENAEDDIEWVAYDDDYYGKNNIHINDLGTLNRYMFVDILWGSEYDGEIDTDSISEESVKLKIGDAIYVLDHQELFSEAICRESVTTQLCCGVLNVENLKKYKPKYIYGAFECSIDLKELVETDAELSFLKDSLELYWDSHNSSLPSATNQNGIFLPCTETEEEMEFYDLSLVDRCS